MRRWRHFHVAKPSDLIPELQGRFPFEWKTQGLAQDDFKEFFVAKNALTPSISSLIRKRKEVYLEFNDAGIEEIARLAFLN